MSATKPKEIIIDGQQIPFKDRVKILGLNLTRTGLTAHVKERKRLADHQLIKLKRFRAMNTEVKVYLFKALIRPVLEYPSITTCLVSRSNMIELQRVQSKALRRAIKENFREHISTNETIHQNLQIEPLNTRIHHLATNEWLKLERINQELTTRSVECNEDRIYRDHVWWPRIAKVVTNINVDPIYK